MFTVHVVFDSIFSVHYAAKRYILQQKCLRGQIETCLLGTRWYNYRAPYIDHENHSAQRYRQTDRQSDRQTDVIAFDSSRSYCVAARSAKNGVPKNFGSPTWIRLRPLFSKFSRAFPRFDPLNELWKANCSKLLLNICTGISDLCLIGDKNLEHIDVNSNKDKRMIDLVVTAYIRCLHCTRFCGS